MLPWPRPPPILVLNVVFGKLVPNPSCVPNLKLLASTVAEISRGPIFYAPLAHIPANFGLKCCFFGKLVPYASCVPNLKLLIQRLRKYVGGPKFLDVHLPQPPSNFVLNVVFGKQHPIPKWCKNFVAHVHV